MHRRVDHEFNDTQSHQQVRLSARCNEHYVFVFVDAFTTDYEFGMHKSDFVHVLAAISAAFKMLAKDDIVVIKQRQLPAMVSVRKA